MAFAFKTICAALAAVGWHMTAIAQDQNIAGLWQCELKSVPHKMSDLRSFHVYYNFDLLADGTVHAVVTSIDFEKFKASGTWHLIDRQFIVVSATTGEKNATPIGFSSVLTGPDTMRVETSSQYATITSSCQKR